MTLHPANPLFLGGAPPGYPAAPADPAQIFNFYYYWDFFLTLPLAYKVGLVCLAALLYHAIRSQR